MQGKEGKVGMNLFAILSLFFLLTVQASSTNTSADATIRPSTVHELELTLLSFEFQNHYAATIDIMRIESHFCWQDYGEKSYFKDDPENLVRTYTGENRTFYLTLFIPNFLNESEQSRECQVDTKVFGLWESLYGVWDHNGLITVEQERDNSAHVNATLWLILITIVVVVAIVSIGIFFIKREG